MKVEIEHMGYLWGPNVWRSTPVFEMWICFEEIPDIATLRRFTNRLGLEPGEDPVLAFAEGVCVCQRWAGESTEIIRIKPRTMDLGFRCMVAMDNEYVAEAAALATQVIWNEPESDVDIQRALVVAAVEENGLNADARIWVDAARNCGVPCVVKDMAAGEVQLGNGIHQHLFVKDFHEGIGTIAHGVLDSPDLVGEMLFSVGLPSKLQGSLEVANGSKVIMIVIGEKVLAFDEYWIPVDCVPRETLRLMGHTARIIGLEEMRMEVVFSDVSAPVGSRNGVVTGVALLSLSEVPEVMRLEFATMMVRNRFQEENSGRIPIACVTGVNGKTTTARLLAKLLGASGNTIGLTCTEGIFLGREELDEGDCSGPASARAILAHPGVEGAVFETARGGILRNGLGFDSADVSVVTNIGEGDHLGHYEVSTLDELCEVKSVVAKNARRAVVLNASDPLTKAMAKSASAPVIFFAIDASEAESAAAEMEARFWVTVDGEGWIRLMSAGTSYPLMPVSSIPLTQGARLPFQIENVLAAVAAAWALGVSFEEMIRGLTDYAATLDAIPGRFNVLDIGGVTVVVDYGHNVSALRATLKVLEGLSHQRRACVFSVAGDRQDHEIVEQGRWLGDAFDHVFIYEDTYLRGREDGEISGMMMHGIEDGKRAQETETFVGWEAAVDQAMEWAQPGDLLFVQPNTIREAVDYFKRNPKTREIDLKEL